MPPWPHSSCVPFGSFRPYCFLIYALFGQYFPGPMATRGYDLSQVIEQMAFGTEGIYGTPLYVSATYIFSRMKLKK